MVVTFTSTTPASSPLKSSHCAMWSDPSKVFFEEIPHRFLLFNGFCSPWANEQSENHWKRLKTIQNTEFPIKQLFFCPSYKALPHSSVWFMLANFLEVVHTQNTQVTHTHTSFMYFSAFRFTHRFLRWLSVGGTISCPARDWIAQRAIKSIGEKPSSEPFGELWWATNIVSVNKPTRTIRRPNRRLQVV